MSVRPQDAVRRNMALVLSIMIRKGGSGKSTTTVNMAYLFAHLGLRVLVVDCDEQGNSGSILGLTKDEKSEPSKSDVYDLLFTERDPHELVVESPYEGIKVIPAPDERRDVTIGDDLAVLASKDRDRAELLLKNRLRPLSGDFDIIIIDAPPAKGIISNTIICASNRVITPVNLERLAYDGVKMLFRDIIKLKEKHGLKVKYAGTLFTKVQFSRKLQKEAYEKFIKGFGEFSIKHTIRMCAAIDEANTAQKPVFLTKKGRRCIAGSDYILAMHEIGMIDDDQAKSLLAEYGTAEARKEFKI